MPVRLNPFLERRLHPPPPPPAPRSFGGRLQDGMGLILSVVAFVTAVGSLVTSVSAFLATRTIPPVVTGGTITIVRSSEVKLDDPPVPIEIRDDSQNLVDFPVMLSEPKLLNVGHSESKGVVGIVSTLSILSGQAVLFQSEYVWHRFTASTSKTTGNAESIVFDKSAPQVASFALPADSVWNKEVLFIPEHEHQRSAYNWDSFLKAIGQHCEAPSVCKGSVAISVQILPDKTLTATCGFTLTDAFIANLKGVPYKPGITPKHYFSSPACT